jgi:hypothetical protein
MLLIAGAVATGATLLAEAVSLAFPPITEDQELSDNPMGVAVIFLVFFLGLLDVMIYITTVVFFLIWLHRANSNLKVFNPWTRLEHTAGWAVGSFFIPFVNLVVPYHAVREVWRKSLPPDEVYLAETSPPASFPLWWLFWLTSSFANNLSFRLTFNETVSEQTATIVSIAAGALSIVAAVFCYMVVGAIDKKQEAAAAKLNLGRVPGPPLPPRLPPEGATAATPITHNPQQV